MKAHIRDATDEQLSARIAKEASEEACTELFRRYSKRVYLWCYNYTHDADEAIDLTQEIFIKMFRNIGTFSQLSSFSTWAYSVARNHCLGELSKKRTRWRRRMFSIEDCNAVSKTDDDVYGILDAKGDLERIMVEASDVMREDEIEAFVLHYGEGLTVREVTMILGCENVTGARTLIQNARRKFRWLIEEKGFGNE